MQPHRRQPTRLPRPWDSPGKNTGVGCHCLLQCVKVESESEVTQSCPTLSDPMGCSLPGSSVHGIFQARILEWVAVFLYSYIKDSCQEICILSRKQNRLYLKSRTPSWDGLWTLSYMPSIYGNHIPTGKPGPWKEEPQGSPSLKRTPNYLCNQIESCILLCLLRNDHKPIDNCPLLTT